MPQCSVTESGPGQSPAPPPREPPPDRLQDLRDAARAIAEAIEGTRLDERELVTLFFQQGFFAALDYDTGLPLWPGN